MKFRHLLFYGLVTGSLLGCSRYTSNQPKSAGWSQVPEILARIQAPQFRKMDYNLVEFGGIGDSTTDNKAAFDNAIKKCNDSGGGRVVVPKGVWLVNGPIHLKSNVHLFLQDGATIRFNENPEFYLPVVLTKWEGTELFNYSPLIYAYQVTNVAISGNGIIDGNAKNSFAVWKPNQKAAQNKLRQMGADGVPVNERIFGEGHWLRPSMIQFYGCKNVLVDGVKILDSPFWVIHPVFCQNVIVRNVHVESWNANNDGCDPDASVDVLIENCIFNCGDDGVAIKAGRDQDGWRVGQATENVIIRNCELRSKANGLCIGSEMSGGVRNVYMENCLVGAALSTVYFKSNLDRGGVISDVWVRNVQVQQARGACIRFESNYKGHRGNIYPPLFKNFIIENITCELADNYGIFAEGVKESRLQNIILKDIEIKKAGEAIRIQFADNFVLKNVIINGEPVAEHPEMTPADKPKLDMGW